MVSLGIQALPFESEVHMKDCYRCGAPGDMLLDDGDSAVCYPCDDRYRVFLDEQYPYGQCQECGAEYTPANCSLGVNHVFAIHIEGACSQWRDPGAMWDTDPDDLSSAGYCLFGCRPTPLPF